MKKDELHDRTYKELHALARAYFDREGKNHTLQPTALVHEVYMRLAGNEVDFNDREHFLATAARIMRRVLVDHARARNAAKRGGEQGRVELENIEVVDDRVKDVLALNEALEQLMEEDEELARVVELRFFGGMSEEEVASTLNVSRRTITRRFQMARSWLRNRLSDETRHGS